jgi:putative ABC transport system permease protein
VPFPGLTRLFRLAVRPPAVEQEVDAEIAFHLEEEARVLVRRGLSPEAARLEAARRFGDLRSTRAALARLDRERRGKERRMHWLDDLSQDIGYAVRGFRRQPAFAALVIVTLGLGIGANATMFGIVDRILVRPPAFLKNPELTGRVYLRRPTEDGERIDNNISYKRYLDLREGSRTLAATAAFYDDDQRIVGSGDDARQRNVSLVSADYWSMFDIRPVLGRFFTAEEDRTPTGAAVAVLGYGFWQTGFGGDPAVVGRQLYIGSRQHTIIGVAPKGFTGTSLNQVSAFVPITTAAFDDFGPRYYTGHNISWLEMLARRKPGVTREAADADLTLAFQKSRTDQPGVRPETIPRSRAELAPVNFDRGPKPRNEAKVATWLAGVAAVVLLIACANVINLLLARGLSRRREIAVRLAIGAGRRRLLRQLLTESMLLALGGGVAGLLIAHFGGGVLRRALLSDVDWSSTPLFDPRMLGFTGLVALLTGVLTGLTPAWQAGRTDLAETFKAFGKDGGRPRARLRTGLLVAQAALSVILLVGAGLFVRSLTNVRSVDLGYDSDRLIFVRTDLRGQTLSNAERGALQTRLLERVRGMPGVEGAAATFGIPFWISNSIDLFVPGRDSLIGLGSFYQNLVTDDYFTTTGTTLVRGRALSALDRSGARVAVVSEMLARKVWPGDDAIGKCVKINADTMPCTEVVGIAKDVRWGSLGDEDRMQIYQPMALDDGGTLFIRATGDPGRLIEPVRRALQGLMPGMGFVNVRRLGTTLDPVLRPWRLGATMFTLFGGLALVVAAIGLYGVIAYSVAQRTHEMGVRAALGATRADLMRLVVGEGLRVTLAGIALGAVGALAGGRFIASLLFGVSARDPLILGAVATVLVVVAATASLIPAWRAGRADPSVALRAD